ncbi:MAG: antibiotic biosynthesis monooxygenase [Rubrobacter sp.]|nr:antibiotic biosynthesis monooxygenase [Rubrobacter sp.]
MVREIAVFRIGAGREQEFEEAYRGIASLLEDAEGSGGAVLHRGVEDPEVYTLIVEWDSVEAHVALTNRPEFEQFGEAVGPYLAGTPDVRHIEPVA